MGRSFSSGGPKGAVNGKPTARLRAHNHAEGLTRRLRRGRWGCRPEGGSTFFRSERKYQRKHAARRLREKGFYCPFCRRGSLCRARPNWPDFTCDRARSELAFFRRQNGRAFFPSLPIAARLPRSWRGDILNPCRGDALAWLVFFRKAKGQREIKSTLTFTASRRACRPTAVFPIQLAQSHTRPASREACCRAAVNLRSSCFHPSALRA